MNVHATLAETGARPRLLMCPPRHFAVTYSINPWMDPRAWADDGQLHADAERQWAALHEALIKAGAAVETMEPAADRPDLVFTANAAVVLDRKAVLSRFRHRERRDEEPIFAAAFAVLAQRGLLDEVSALPDGMILEGAGDCIWDPRRRCSGSGAASVRTLRRHPSSSGNWVTAACRCRWPTPAFITWIRRFAPCRAEPLFTIRPRSRPPPGAPSKRMSRRSTASRSIAPMPNVLPPMRSALATRSYFRATVACCGRNSGNAAMRSLRRRYTRFCAAAARHAA